MPTHPFPALCRIIETLTISRERAVLKTPGAAHPGSADWAEGRPDGVGMPAPMLCANCGAGFSADETRCPYCGALNAGGAERAYMEALDDIKEDTEELASDAQRGFTTNLHGNARRAVRIILAVIVVMTALFLAFNAMNGNEEQRAIESYQARESFRTQHFAEMNRLYAAGDDEALSDYVLNLVDEPGYDAVFAWEHYAFLEALYDYGALQMFMDDARAASAGLEDYTWAVSTAMRLAQLDDAALTSYSTQSETDEKRAAEYRAFAWSYLEDELQMDKQEVIAFADEARDEYGYIQRDELSRKLEPLLRQRGAID